MTDHNDRPLSDLLFEIEAAIPARTPQQRAEQDERLNQLVREHLPSEAALVDGSLTREEQALCGVPAIKSALISLSRELTSVMRHDTEEPE